MSSSKREKRRKKSTKKTALERYAQQKDQSGKDEALSVDFFFLLIGMITTLMTFLLVCSLFTTNPNTTAALEAAKVGDATKEVNATDDEEFDDVLNSSDAAQLTNILRGLNSSSVKVSSGKAVKTNQRRVEVVNHLLTKKLDDEQHKYAVTSKLNALTTIYGLRLVMDKVPDVAESLRSTSKKYLDVTDDDVRKLAHLSLFKVNAFEMAKENKEEIEVQLLVNDMCKLLKKFPNDDLVLGTLDTIVEVYRKIDPDIGLEVTKTLQSREKEFADSPKVAQLIRDYVDETTLDGYQELFNNRWVDGVSGQKQLFEDSLQLISDPSAGALVLKTVDEVAHWFEQDDQYENAVGIYKAMLKSSKDRQSSGTSALARKLGGNGIARSRMVGEKIDLSGLNINGEEVSAAEFENKIVMVVFWSVYKKQSSQFLLKMSIAGRRWEERGIRILAVNKDQEVDASLIHDAMKPISNVTFVFGDAKNNYANNIFEQCPSDKTPRVMLVQRDGHVVDINVPLGEAVTQVDLLSR